MVDDASRTAPPANPRTARERGRPRDPRRRTAASPHSRMVGLDKTAAPLVVPLDGDDLVEPGVLSRDGRPPRRHARRGGVRRRHARVRRPRGAAGGPGAARSLPRRLHQRVPHHRGLPPQPARGGRRLAAPQDQAAGLRGLGPVDGHRRARVADRAPRPAPRHLPPPPPRPPPQPPGARAPPRDLPHAARLAPAACSPSCPSTGGAPTSPACASSSIPSCTASARASRSRTCSSRSPTVSGSGR